jgi:hypothetical protein
MALKANPDAVSGAQNSEEGRRNSQVDRTFLIGVLFVFMAQWLFVRCVSCRFQRNSARILASSKECHGQENRSAQ